MSQNAYDQTDVDITSMGRPEQPYAGAYSDTSWNVPKRASVEQTKATWNAPNNDSLEQISTVKVSTEKGSGKGGSSGVIGMGQMDSWNATRFIVYVFTRVAQLVVAIVCIGFQADSRNKRPSDSVDTVERNTEIAVYVVAAITAGTALVSILLHMFAKTRQRIEKSRLAWFAIFFNFAVFVTWIILMLINVVAVDCSRKVDGSWCRSIKASLATGLISAMFSLVVTLRSLSVLVRSNRIHI
ncbi:hypothetical protein IWW50_000371 [Coemansia erecta]|nr:hypothetical protein GGF43_003452 [Coemansia sp. RSA 2618]KAJ2830285.1 hypothetical protein IWW50_000371 [Coemansia erecta]